MSASRHRNDHVRSTALLAGVVAVVCLLAACSGGSSRSSSARATGAAPASTSSAPPTTTPAPRRLQASLATWRLPSARSREVAVATPIGLVVAGGLSSAQVSTSTVWTLSAGSGRVVRTGSLAAPVHDATGVVLGGTPLVVAGGNTTTVDDVQRIGRGDTAHVVGHLPQPRSDLVAAVIGDRAFVLGGFDGTTSLSAVLATKDGHRFRPVAQLPVTVRYPAVAALGNELLVFGGEHNGAVIDDVQQVDLRSGQARVLGHLSQPLAHESAAVIDGVVWLVGGRTGGQLQRRVWRWEPSQRRSVAAGRLPYAVADAGLAVEGSTAYLLGGETPEPTARVVLLRAAGPG